MERPSLIPWRPPENDDTNAEFYDCEIGGRGDTLDLEEPKDDGYATILELLRQRNDLLLKLHELDPYQRVPSPRKSNASELSRDGEAKSSECSEPMSNHSKRDTGYSDTSGGARETTKNFYLEQQGYYWMTRNSPSYENEDRFVPGEDTLEQEYFGNIEDLIATLNQSNQELLNEVNYLQKEEQDSGVHNNSLEGYEDLSTKIGELIVKNKTLEKGLRTRDPLQESLQRQLETFIRTNLSATEISEIEDIARMENTSSGNSHDYKEIKTDSYTQTELNLLGNDVKISGKIKDSGTGSQTQERHTEHGMVNGQQGDDMVPKNDYDVLEKEFEDIKLQLNTANEDKAKMRENLDFLTDHYSKQDNMQRMHIEKIEQENKQYYNMLIEYQSGEQGRNRDIDSVLMQAERERNEKIASIAEQKVLRQQIENLSKTMKSMQLKNEELVRMQCSQEDHADDFQRLKQLFQESGLPTIEQIITLQRQNEAFREDILNERKEKERLLSIKDKLRRDLDSMQSRISSLQEQVYKYREHIFFLQQRTGKDGPTSPAPPSPLLENAPPSPLNTSHTPSFHNPSRLYGSNAPQYINEGLLQGNVPPRFPLYAVSETGKKGPPGKHGGMEGQTQGPGGGKQWQFQQQSNFPAKLGRHLSLDGDSWKRSPQSWASPTDNIFNSSLPQRHNSSSSYSSVRSGSSDEGIDGSEKPNQFGRRHSARNGEEFKQLQNFGPTPSQFEAGWPRQNSAGRGIRMSQNPQRNPRRYSSPVGNGVRAPSDYWSQQMPASKQWQTSLEPSQFTDSAPPGLRQCSDPWQQPLTTTLPNSSQASSVAVTSSHGDSGTYSGFGNR